MKKMLMLILMLSMMFIGGMKYKDFDFFVVNDDVAKTVGFLYKDGEKVATITGKKLVEVYNKLLKQKQNEINKKLSDGIEM